MNFLNPNSFFCPGISQGIISSFLLKHLWFSATWPLTCRCGGCRGHVCSGVVYKALGNFYWITKRGWKGTPRKWASGLQFPAYGSELPQKKKPHNWTDERLDAKTWTNTQNSFLHFNKTLFENLLGSSLSIVHRILLDKFLTSLNCHWASQVFWLYILTHAETHWKYGY